MQILGTIFFLLVLWASGAEAACIGSGVNWSCTAGSTIAEVNTAMGNASDGATFTFDAGAYTWTSGMITLHNDKGVTLICASVGACTATIGSSSVIYMEDLTGNNTKTYRVSGFMFTGGNGCLCIFLASAGIGTMNNVRIDHNTFDNFTTGTIAIFFGAANQTGKFYGVVDHNRFTGTNNFMGLKYLGPGSPDRWASSLRGSSQNLYMEDNTFDFTNASDLGSPCMDAWEAAAIVFRYNTTKNCNTGTHGVVHQTVVNFEAYGNTVERTPGSGDWTDGSRLIRHQGSGEYFVWGNSFKHAGTISGGALSLTHYRSADPVTAGYDPSWGRCDGTQARDGNRLGMFGYPCWMQPGRAPAGGVPSYGTLAPVYTWMNVDFTTGNKVPLAIENPWGATNPSVADHIKANRDYYDAVSNSAQTSPNSPFNGTTGMGFGTLANRPTTCTTNPAELGGGVGYFATNEGPQGTLYRCSATNTWTVHYTPYTYPHPLQALGTARSTNPQDIPTNVQVR